MGDSRLTDAEVQRELLKTVKALQRRGQWWKNGETWSQYFTKWLTPQNIVIVVALIYGAGGQVQQMKSNADEAIKVAAEARDANKKLRQSMEELKSSVASQLQAFDAQYVTRSDAASLVDRVNLAVTRGEFREAIQRQVMPRLDRIERTLKEQQ